MKIFSNFFLWIKTHKVLVSLLTFFLIAGAIYLPDKIQAVLEGPQSQYETINPEFKDLIQSVDVSGVVKAQNEAEVKFQTSGKLAWVGVQKGDRVQKWQALASLDKRELEKRLNKELLDFLSERWDFEQNREDYQAAGISLEKAMLSDAGKRILEKDQFNLDQTIIDYEIAKISYDLATIYSPIEGIITDIDIPIAGVNITPATAAITVTNPSLMIFEAKIDEIDIGLVREGQAVVIILDAYPEEKFEGTISKIDFNATTTKGGGTAFPAEIILPENSQLKFKNGMNGDAEIIINKKEQALTIPIEAVKEKDGKSTVRIIENREIKTVEITTGLTTDNLIEVLSGLTTDQTVIVSEKKISKKD